MSLKYISDSNFSTGTVGSNYSSGGGSLVLTSGHGARFPSSGDFWIRVENEVLKVTARSTDTLTVTGAQDGTSAANHNAGVEVRWIMSVGGFDQFRVDVCSTGTDASQPATEKAGKIYLPNNGVYAYRDSGSALVPWGPIFPFTAPIDGDYTWTNQGSAAVSTTQGGIYLSCPSNGGTNSIRIRKKSAPSAPWTLTVGFLPNMPQLNCFAGVGFRQSSDGKLVSMAREYDSGGETKLRIMKFTNETTFSANYLSAIDRAGFRGINFFQLKDDNTNRKCLISADGQNFIEVHTVGRTDFLTADQIFFSVDPAGAETGITLVHWKES